MAMIRHPQAEGYSFHKIFALCDQFFCADMLKMLDQPPLEGRGLLMCAPLWGRDYINRFERFCLPSMLAPKNREALRGSRIILYTDGPGFMELAQMSKRLRREGIILLIRQLPDEIVKEVPANKYNKYWPYGTIHNHGIQLAGWWGMDFHMFSPDVVYAEEYFPNLKRLGREHGAIIQSGFTADEISCVLELEQHRHPDMTIRVPSRTLGDMAWRHLHKQLKYSLMNDRDPENWGNFARSHWMAWRGRDRIHIYCWHANLMFLSAEQCAHAPTRIPATVDAELPAFVKGDFYTPKADDGMALMEVSDDGKEELGQGFSLLEYAAHCWSIVKFKDDHKRFAMKATEFPIAEQGNYLEAHEIHRRHLDLLGKMEELKGEAAIYWAQSLDKNP